MERHLQDLLPLLELLHPRRDAVDVPAEQGEGVRVEVGGYRAGRESAALAVLDAHHGEEGFLGFRSRMLTPEGTLCGMMLTI